jgi:hypothetical protein
METHRSPYGSDGPGHSDGARVPRRVRRGLAAAGLAVCALLVPAGAAVAAEYPDGGTSTATVTNDPGTPAVEVAGRTEARDTMPFTGGDVAALAALGGTTVVIGGVLVAQSRRRRAADAV